MTMSRPKLPSIYTLPHIYAICHYLRPDAGQNEKRGEKRSGGSGHRDETRAALKTEAGGDPFCTEGTQNTNNISAVFLFSSGTVYICILGTIYIDLVILYSYHGVYGSTVPMHPQALPC